MKLIATVALPILVLRLALLFYRHAVISSSPLVLAAQLAALALNVSARASFGALIFFWASILGHWSLVNALVGLSATAVIAVRIGVEERLLSDRYPDYGDYAGRTKRLVPYVI